MTTGQDWTSSPNCVRLIGEADKLARAALSDSIGIGHVMAVLKGRGVPPSAVERSGPALALTPRCRDAMNLLATASTSSDSDALELLISEIDTASTWDALIDGAPTEDALLEELNGRASSPPTISIDFRQNEGGADPWNQRPWGSVILRNSEGFHLVWPDGRPAQVFIDTMGYPVLSAAGRIVHVTEDGDLAEFDRPDGAANWPAAVAR